MTSQQDSHFLRQLMTLVTFCSLQSVTPHPYFTSIQPSIATFPGPLTTFESLKYPGNYLVKDDFLHQAAQQSSITSDAKLTTIVNHYGPAGLVEQMFDHPDEPNPWFRMNYTGQHRLRDHLCDAKVEGDAICVGSQALVGDTGQASRSDEDEVQWRIELNAKESREMSNSWSVYIELATRGLVCLEFNDDNNLEASSLQPYFMDIDLDAETVDKNCLFVATNY